MQRLRYSQDAFEGLGQSSGWSQRSGDETSRRSELFTGVGFDGLEFFITLFSPGVIHWYLLRFTSILAVFQGADHPSSAAESGEGAKEV